MKHLVGQAGSGDSSRQLVRNLGSMLRAGNLVWEVISIQEVTEATGKGETAPGKASQVSKGQVSKGRAGYCIIKK